MAPHSIVDAQVGSGIPPYPGHPQSSPTPEVIGTTINLVALTGAIGADSNFLEVDSSYYNLADTTDSNHTAAAAFGVPNAVAPGVIRVTQTAGDLHVGLVSTCSFAAACADISLATDAGSITDGNNAGAGTASPKLLANVVGDTIDLDDRVVERVAGGSPDCTTRWPAGESTKSMNLSALACTAGDAFVSMPVALGSSVTGRGTSAPGSWHRVARRCPPSSAP
ncbi:MAG: hypothetical protein ACRDOK_11120 [Streptosporangiaceae bacterium]